MAITTGVRERARSRQTIFEENIATRDGRLTRGVVLAVSLSFFVVFLLLPLFAVFVEAFRKGWQTYIAALMDPDAQSAIRLTLFTAAWAVTLNVIFGLAAAWAISKFNFWGKRVLITLIDLPFSVSPVIAGLIYILLFGAQGWFGPLLESADIKIVFALPGSSLPPWLVPFPLLQESSFL